MDADSATGKLDFLFDEAESESAKGLLPRVAVLKVKSVATRRFWELFQALPSDVQKLAVKNYRLWRQNPSHPSLRFRRLQAATIVSQFAWEITTARSAR